MKAKDIFSAKLNDSVKEAMAMMRTKNYTCIPIVDDSNRVIGIFGEGSVFDYLADEGIVELSDDLRFEDLKEYIDVGGRKGTLNLFVPYKYPVDKLLNRIESAMNAKERFQVAIITNNGDKSEPMQGLVTLWDIVAGNEL